MKPFGKFTLILCLALAFCLAVPALLPAGLDAAVSAQASSGIKLNKTKATIYNGKTLTLKITGTKSKVKWSSSDTSVAKVSSKGVVTARKVGKATITAKVGSKAMKCAVTVKSPLSASATSVTLDAGKTKKVTLSWKLNGSISIKAYDSSTLNCSLAYIKDGKCTLTIKGIRAGTETLTIGNSKTNDVVRIKVKVRATKTDVKIVDKSSVSISKGKSATVKVTWPFDGMPYVAYDPSAVEVSWGAWNGSGWPMTIKGLAKGTSDVILYKGEGGEKAAAIKVTVK